MSVPVSMKSSSALRRDRADTRPLSAVPRSRIFETGSLLPISWRYVFMQPCATGADDGSVEATSLCGNMRSKKRD